MPQTDVTGLDKTHKPKAYASNSTETCRHTNTRPGNDPPNLRRGHRVASRHRAHFFKTVTSKNFSHPLCSRSYFSFPGSPRPNHTQERRLRQINGSPLNRRGQPTAPPDYNWRPSCSCSSSRHLNGDEWTSRPEKFDPIPARPRTSKDARSQRSMMACGTLFTAAVASAVIVKTVPSATSRNTSLASRTPRARARTERLFPSRSDTATHTRVTTPFTFLRLRQN